MDKKICFILGLFLFGTASYSQTRIFTVDKGSKYELYFVDVAIRDTKEDSHKERALREDENLKFLLNFDTVNSFVINNKKLIQEISMQWKGDSTRDFLLCWYHYFIYVVKDGEIIDELRVNTECKQVVSRHGLFFYKDFMFDKIDKKQRISLVDLDADVTAPKKFMNELNGITDVYFVKTDAPSKRARYFSKNYSDINRLVKKYGPQQKL